MIAGEAVDVIGNREVQIFYHDNTGGFLLKVKSETPAVFLIHLELHPSPYETKKSITLTL
jgi:hypothetical protein